MIFEYEDKDDEEGISWKFKTIFNDEKWNNLLDWYREEDDVMDTESLIKWIRDSVENGYLIDFNFKRAVEKENSLRKEDYHYSLSPKNWVEEIVAYLGEETGMPLVYDFEIKVSKELWKQSHKTSKEVAEKLEKAKEVVNEAKKNQETKKNLKDFDIFFKYPWSEKFQKFEKDCEEKLEKEKPEQKVIEIDYEGIKVKMVLEMVSESYKLYGIQQGFFDNWVEKGILDLDEVFDKLVQRVWVEFEYHSRFYNFEQSFENWPEPGHPFTVDLEEEFFNRLNQFVQPEDSTRIWNELTGRVLKLFKSLDIKKKEEVLDKVVFDFTGISKGFEGTFELFVSKKAWQDFKNGIINLEMLFKSGSVKKVKVSGNYIFQDFNVLFTDTFEKKVAFDKTFDNIHSLDNFADLAWKYIFDGKLLSSKDKTDFEEIWKNFIYAMKKESYGGNKKSYKNPDEALEDLGDIHRKTLDRLTDSIKAKMVFDEARKNPHYNPQKLKDLKMALEISSAKFRISERRFGEVLEKIKSSL